MESSILKIKNLSNNILNNINLSVKKSEIVVIQGKNGAGKTTLFKCVKGLIPYKGKIIFDSKNRIQFLFQNHPVFPHLTFLENICFPEHPQRVLRKTSDFIDKILNRIRLTPILHRYPAYLSGGENQIAGLLRVLIQEREIILLDEPFNHIEKSIRNYLMEIIQSLAEKGITFIINSHIPLNKNSRMLWMEEGKITECHTNIKGLYIR